MGGSLRKRFRISTIILTMVFLLSFIFPMGILQAWADDSYQIWKQTDPRWASVQLTGNPNYTVRSIGCVVSSIAILSVHYGCETESSINPGILTTKLRENNGFLSDGSLLWAKVNTCIPKMEYAGFEILPSQTQSRQDVAKAIYAKLQEGYAIVVAVKNSGHYVAVNCATEDSVSIFDPGYQITDLFDYDISGITKFHMYRCSGTVVTPPQPIETEKVPGYYSVDVVTSLNVRSEPSTSGAILGGLTDRYLVYAEEFVNGFAKIQYEERTAYVSANYLEFQAEKSEATYDTYAVCSDCIPFYEKPDTDSKVVTTRGYEVQTLKIYFEKDGWGLTDWYQQATWVEMDASKFSLIEEEPSLEDADIYETATLIIPNSITSESVNITYYTDHHEVILYNQPWEDKYRVQWSVLSQNTLVSCLSVENGYAYIQKGDCCGWAKIENLTQLTEENCWGTSWIRLHGAELYDTPETDEKTSYLEGGVLVQVYGQQKDRLLIKNAESNQTGWVDENSFLGDDWYVESYDLDCNQRIDSEDICFLAEMIANPSKIADEVEGFCDMNEDGILDCMDLLTMCQMMRLMQ